MKSILSIFLLVFIPMSCGLTDSKEETEKDTESNESVTVEAVEYNVSNGKYNFAVTLSSPDLGCDQYADWWEVVDNHGTLLYRRVLGHSHVKEQPFTRSGGALDLDENDILTFRGHMNNTGYGIFAMQGSIEKGFSKVELADDYAAELESELPKPPKCAF